ncbi:MAG: type II secretion system protein GspG [Verrucomicrobiae bacterium]|nr:type II secretion system protein GspG [Verrucomicrobiae bacterium]
MHGLNASLIRYQMNHDEFPSTEQGLDALVHEPHRSPMKGRWKSLSIPAWLVDVWGHPYRYRFPGIKHPDSYDLYSIGNDGIEGSNDDIWLEMEN